MATRGRRSCSSAACVRYKGKVYSSASAALEAYLEDLDPAGSAGKSRSRARAPEESEIAERCAQGLDACPQYLGLDSLTSVCRSYNEHDPDSLSLTTEELLALPADGSQPFLHPHPFKSRHLSAESSKTSSRPSQTFSRPLERGFDPMRTKQPHGSKGRTKPLEEFSNTFPSRNYPRWLPSQQADLSASGRSSIPTFPYPTGLKTYNLFSHPTPDRSNQSQASSSQLLETGPRDSPHSHFSFPTDSLHPRGEEREASCYYDPTHGCFPLENPSLGPTKKLLGEHRLLPLKATMESSSEDGTSVEKESSSSTTGILGVGKPWEAAPSASNPPACCEDVAPPPSFPKASMMHKFLEDCLNANSRVSGGHPRPLEALKLLLFQLQAIQASLSQRECAERKEELPGGEEPESQVFAPGRTPLTKSIHKALQQCLQSLEAQGGHREGFYSSRR